MNEAGDFAVSKQGAESLLGLTHEPHCPVEIEELPGRRWCVSAAHVTSLPKSLAPMQIRAQPDARATFRQVLRNGRLRVKTKMNIDSSFIIVTLPALMLSGARRCAEIRHVNHASSDDGDT